VVDAVGGVAALGAQDRLADDELPVGVALWLPNAACLLAALGLFWRALRSES